MNSLTAINTADAVRNLIVCDTQFGWTGTTSLKLQEMLDLQQRGWLAEGDENNEFDLTEAGRAVVAQALQFAVPATLATVKPGGSVQLAGRGTALPQDMEVQADGLVDTARRNIRQFISKASFASPVDKQAALSCVDVLEEAALAARQPGVQEPVVWSVLQIGNIGSFYDPKGTRRAFTYADQPGNIVASKLGRATLSAANASAGDSIDRGLALLKSLHDQGFGVFQIGEYAAPPAQCIDLGQQEDAERYRWLRDQYDPSVHDDEDGSFLRLAGEELDAAIDDQRDAAPEVPRG